MGYNKHDNIVLLVLVMCSLIIAIAVFISGFRISNAIEKDRYREITRAYMLGITAEPLGLPLFAREGKKYILRTYTSNEDCEITEIFRSHVDQKRYADRN